MISIVIPTCNSAKYIISLMNRLLRQTIFNNLEIIFVDNGSIDNTCEILSRYNVNVVKLNKNYGNGVARNIGIQKATKKYICFLDIDDDVFDNTYELLYQGIIKYQTNICGGNVDLSINVYWNAFSDEFYNYMFINKYEGIYKICDFQCPFFFQRYIYNRQFLIDNDICFSTFLNDNGEIFLANVINNTRYIAMLPVDTYKYCFVNDKYIFWENLTPLQLTDVINSYIIIAMIYKQMHLYLNYQAVFRELTKINMVLDSQNLEQILHSI